jgi:hypothetical protein
MGLVAAPCVLEPDLDESTQALQRRLEGYIPVGVSGFIIRRTSREWKLIFYGRLGLAMTIGGYHHSRPQARPQPFELTEYLTGLAHFYDL